jgi:hypothetical protein
MATAWVEASKELGFIFKSPYILKDGSNEIIITGFISDFGGENGVAILGRYDSDEADDMADKLNILCPSLSPESYENFNRTMFIDTLKEWEWSSSDKDTPEWY